MIHDACIEVSCDGPNCIRSVYVPLEFGYATYSGEKGSYRDSDADVEKTLAKQEEDWIVEDGKHYCCRECWEDAQ